MRDNLLFFGIEESDGEDFSVIDNVRVSNEDCVSKVTRVINEKLDIGEEILVEPAHRLGFKARVKIDLLWPNFVDGIRRKR